MSKSKNEEILKNISNTDYRGYSKTKLRAAMQKNEVAGQKVMYLYISQTTGVNIDPEEMDKYQSDGVFKNAINESKLNEKEGGGLNKVLEELYVTIPNRLKDNGERVPNYRIYTELETFQAEVYDCHLKFVASFDWYKEPEAFLEYATNTTEAFEYNLEDDEVDLVEIIQNIYKVYGIKDKITAYKIMEKGVTGWFKPFDITKADINKLILNNDKMNEKFVQKNQGAFFTPSEYVKISTEYVMNAIEQSKKDGFDDYIIIDRCAGVGNLESQFSKDIYSHMILGTVNEGEALVANIRFNGQSTVELVNALSTKRGVSFYQDKIKEYKKDNNVERLAVIFLENPPYADTNSNKKGGVGEGVSKQKRKENWVKTKMLKGGKDLDEQFVFSAFEYFDTYAYIHYGPIKIWKSQHLIDKEVKDAYLCNRKYFNAGEAAIALLHWTSKDVNNDTILFDSDFPGKFPVHKVKKTISQLYSNDGKENGICVVEARNYSFDSPRMTGSLNDDERYGKKWVSANNLLKTLPLFCVSRDKTSETGAINDEKDYRVIGTTYKTADQGNAYQKDKGLLQDSLLWCLCTQHNHCSVDGKFWKWAEETLDDNLKDTEIWSIYKALSKETKLNGLNNIKKYDRNDTHGKLWKVATLNPKVKELENLLQKFYESNLRVKFLKYGLLK